MGRPKKDAAGKPKPKPKRLIIRKYLCTDYQKAALESLLPPESITVSEWAERHRVLVGGAEPGPWNNSRTPYLIGIMDEFTNYETEEIIFVKPTQVGGTECMNNMLGYVITQDPAPTEVVYPTEDLAESVSDKRLKPMIETCPPLARKFDAQSKKLELTFSDMFVKLVGSNSPVGVASFAMKYLFIDEIDKFPGASRREADPVSLAEERTKTFRGRKIFKTSTPTLRTGHIWRAKESADIEKHYLVPCPHCGAFIELKFAQLRWPGKDGDLVDAYGVDAIRQQMAEHISNEPDGEGLSNQDRAEFAFYICQECGVAITDQQKQRIIGLGRWEVVERRTKFARSVCFWMSTLYSPFVHFSEIAAKFMASKQDPEKLQNFVNSWLAEPWEDTKLKTSSNLVLDRQTGLPQYVVPAWAKVLTGGVDVQQDCLYWTIRAYGDYITSQNIAHGVAYSFTDVEQIMNAHYPREDDGTVMVVNLCLVDSGNDTDKVYDFCVLNSEWAVPVKGASHEMQDHYKRSVVNKNESRAFGMPLIIVDGSKYKDMIASRMRRENGRGSWMVYQGCDEEYARQVTAEQKTMKRVNGKEKLTWIPKASHAKNHYLDCEVYSLAAADILGVRMFHLQTKSQKEPAQQAPPENKPAGGNDGDWLPNGDRWI